MCGETDCKLKFEGRCIKNNEKFGLCWDEIQCLKKKLVVGVDTMCGGLEAT